MYTRRRMFKSNFIISVNYSLRYFTIEALENELQVKLSVNACEYSLDGNTWNRLSAATNTPTVDKGQRIYFKGNLTPTSSNGIGTFTISKKCNVEGNIMSLLYGDDFEEQTDLTGKDYAFYKLFSGCTRVVDASDLILPATTLTKRCYYNMFQGCTGLTTAPALPATTLENYCYSNMFNGCSKLNTITMLATDKSANSLTYWVAGVASTGTFFKNPDMASLPSGDSGIPSGWTVENINNV